MAEVVGPLILSSVGLGEFAGLALFGSAVTVGTAVGSAVLVGGSLVAASMLAASPAANVDYNVPKPRDGTQTLKQSVPPRLFGYGRVRIGGAYMLFEASGTIPGTSYDVIALHHGRISGFVHWFLNDDLCSRNPGTGILSPIVFDDGRYAGSVQIGVRYGVVPETIHDFTVVFPGIWTTSHRGDGIASCSVTCQGAALEDQTHVFPRGLPKVSVVADLSLVYDPRDTTQSDADPTTWTASRNPVIQLIDFLTSSDHGMGLDWDTVIEPVIDDLMVQADYCDELVARAGGGYEKRYESHGFAYLTTDPADVLGSILSACDGWLSEGPDGTIALRVGKYVAPTVTFTDDHIVSATMQYGVADEEIVNQLSFSYTPAANDYRDTQGLAWTDDASVAEIGKVRSQSVSYTWVHSHAQARRLAKRAMARHQATMRGTLILTLAGLRALGERWLAIRSDQLPDLSDAVVEVTRMRVDLLRAHVSVDWILVNPNEIDAWETTEEGDEPRLIYNTNVSAAPTYISITDLGSHRIRIRIDLPVSPALRYVVGYKIGAGTETFVDFVEPPTDANTVDLVINPGAAGTYTLRVAYRNRDGSLSSYATNSITIA